MSFKYRFIISFVLLEVFFILLIVTMNFFTINNSSKKLITQKIESNMSFLDKSIRVPISIYDLANLDDLVLETTNIEYINSIVILDTQNRVISKSYNFENMKLEEVLLNKDNQSIQINDSSFEIRHLQIKEEDIKLGELYVIFDTSDNYRFIKENQKNTFYLILIEILISILLSYFIGNRVTKALTKLTEVAEDIGDNKEPEIPFQNRKDEIGILSRSMNQMQIDLQQRNERLEDFTNELHQQKAELEFANKAKDDFLANMSHELKTPLNSINVISSIMMKNTKKILNEEQVKNLSIINNCGNDLLFLINDVLDVSKLEAGEIKIVNEMIDFKLTMNYVYEMFKAQMDEKNINFIFKYDDDIGMIYSDEQRIKQVVKNLLSNALKFTQNGTIKLLVTSHSDFVYINVEDDGIGIPQDKLENIFDRFKQVDESTTRNYGGTGLGLTISKELVVLLGGDIVVTSELNIGTSFKISIDKHTENLKNNETNIINHEIENIAHNLSRPNILVLHNDPVSFFKLVISLQKKHKTIQSNNTINFLDDYKNNSNIDLAIIDTSSIDKINLEKIILKIPIKFILIYSLKIDIFENDKIIRKIKKPFKIDEIVNIIKETYE